MTAETWLIVALTPPAIYGTAIAVEWWVRQWRDHRTVRHYQRQAEQASRDRHPSKYDRDCGRPGCGVCELHNRRRDG